jgi:bifunctional non-homologous end joining protein LigD
MEDTLTIDKHSVRVSNLQKVFYPDTGFTKGDMIHYYMNVSHALLPHLKHRPISLKRYPDGVKGLSFYEKQCPSHRPDWVHVAPVWSKTRKAKIGFCVIDDLASLVWAANIAVLEIHSSLSIKDNLNCPTALVFDLDPGEGAAMNQCCKLAMRVREILVKGKMKSFAKTSGSKGLQLYAPLNNQTTYDESKTFAHALAQQLERETPDKVVSKMSKSLRKGKVFIDWSQNDEHKTTVCVYSMRAKDEPSVSTPVTWDEVEQAARTRAKKPLWFAPADVLKRIEKMGDLFAPVLKLKQKLPAAPRNEDRER